MYGFHGQLMIMSWIPKLGKNILMLSTDPDAIPDLNQLKQAKKSNDTDQDKKTVELVKKRKTTLHSAMKVKVSSTQIHKINDISNKYTCINIFAGPINEANYYKAKGNSSVQSL